MSTPPPATVHPTDAPPDRSHPFRHDVLPFAVSLLLHAGVVVLGIAAVHVVRSVARSAVREQIIIPEMGRMTTDPADGRLSAGALSDPNRAAAQPDFPDVKDASGVTNKPAHDLSQSLGGEPGDAPLAVGPVSSHRAVGTPGGHGPGDGEAGGFAPFGVLGGGGPGGAVSFLGPPVNNVRRVVFVCDASGSMMRSFDSLRLELRKTIEMLRPPQSFNVVFFQENAKPPLDKSLMFVTPANKRRAFEYVDTTAARGTTDPLPGLRLALDMKPELMFFLIDPSDFPDKPAVIELFRKANADKRMKLNTIAFINRNPDDEAFLKQLAEENGGVFRYVSEDDLGR